MWIKYVVIDFPVSWQWKSRQWHLWTWNYKFWHLWVTSDWFTAHLNSEPAFHLYIPVILVLQRGHTCTPCLAAGFLFVGVAFPGNQKGPQKNPSREHTPLHKGLEQKTQEVWWEARRTFYLSCRCFWKHRMRVGHMFFSSGRSGLTAIKQRSKLANPSLASTASAEKELISQLLTCCKLPDRRKRDRSHRSLGQLDLHESSCESAAPLCGLWCISLAPIHIGYSF